MIILIWTVASLIAVSPHIFGLSYEPHSTQNHRCQLTNNLTYQLVSTLGAFYLPLIVMCVIYWKIFQSAKFRIRKGAIGGSSIHRKKEGSKRGEAPKDEAAANKPMLKSSTSSSITKKPGQSKNSTDMNSHSNNGMPKDSETSFVRKLSLRRALSSKRESRSSQIDAKSTHSSPHSPMSEKKSFKKIMTKNKFLFSNIAIWQKARRTGKVCLNPPRSHISRF